MHRFPIGAATVRAIFLGGMLACTGASLRALAQNPNDITLRLTSTTGNPGDTVEVSVDLVAGDLLPEAFTLFVSYDSASLEPLPEAYEIIARNEFDGTPILDDDGNTIADFTIVRISEGVAAAGKNAAFAIHEPPGVVGISVQGLNNSPIPAGPLLTLAFRIRDEVPDGSMIDVLGVTEDSEIHIEVDGGAEQAISSFTRSDPEAPNGVTLMSYGFEDTVVLVGCIPAAAPDGVTATQNRADSVALSWSAVAGENIEYRVYRSETNAPATAAPIGEAWQTETTFSDITAQVPEVIPGECPNPDQIREVHYFYWVRARSEAGCESPLSATPAEGFRIQAKRLAVAAVAPGTERLAIYGVLAAFLLAFARVGRTARQGLSGRDSIGA